MDEQNTTDTPESNGQKPEEFQAAEFQQVNAADGAGSSAMEPNLDVILDVPVTLSLEVGRTEMSVGQLLRLTQGAVVELERSAGEPLDVMVNGALVAHGEIVVINDKFGIRLVDVVKSTQQAVAETTA